MERIVNRVQLATLCNVSLPTIDAWVRRGMPVEQVGSKGKEWQFDISKVINWKEEQARNNALGDTAKINLEEAFRRRAVAEAALQEIKLAKEKKEVVAIADVEEAWGKVIAACRTKLLAVPVKLAPLVANETDPLVVKSILEQSIHDGLTELAGGLPNSTGGDYGVMAEDQPLPDQDSTASETNGKRVGGRKQKIKSGSKRRTRKVGNKKG